ncbi:glutamic acid-rich protein-like isoform X1 [Diabrotica virgifera virgifera]|uniref:PDZ domain-containing protein n=1 Tax=Diabrotica virgifera virgifera TaxID=50390 RepID=A0ABM5IU56_DIAVI|nr:glutamic acid-rich protein-like isoform X1 [Diabrotica virgifera virgifera]
MAIDLKFSKPDPSSNWGFRVVGGADFQQPLVVVKVNEDSLAEKAGLKIGDIIVNVNNKSTATLTHFELQQAISSAGVEFILGIKRGEFVPPEILQDEGKEIEVFLRDVQVLVDEEIIDKAEELAETLGKEIFAEFGQHKAIKTMTKKSNEKLMFSNSTQTYIPTEDKYKQNKFSTFLIKPERPIPKPHKVIEEEKIIEENAYKITIKKQSRRKYLPKEKRVQFDQNISEVEFTSYDAPAERDGTHSPELDSLGSQAEPDSLEENNNEEYYGADNIYERDEEKYSNESEECSECDEVREYDDDDDNFENLRKDSIGMGMKFKPISEIIVDPNSDLSMTLEEQLRAVQKQLQALSQLPSAVQLTLDAVSKQLAEIVSSKEEEENENDEKHSVEDENDHEEGTASQEAAEAESGEDTNSVVGDELDDDSIADEELKAIMERARFDGEQEEETAQEDFEELARIKQEEEEARQRAEEERQREEEESRREEELAAKKEKEMEDQRKATFRPIVLPGGRKWIDPDDVVPTRKPKMTDAKIMETIDSNLEVIAGKRKGINFMKYTPPSKNLDHLQNSEVYRLIHGMKPPTRGITTRPEKILPEQDYYQAGHENA